MIFQWSVPKKIHDFSFYFDLFVDFCYKRCSMMTPENSKKQDIKDNIIGIVIHGEDIVYDTYWYILNKQNIFEKWVEFGKYIDKRFGIIKWYIKNNKIVPEWFNDYFTFINEIEIYNYKKDKK